MLEKGDRLLVLLTNVSFVDPPYCRAEMYAGRVACPVMSHSEYADGTDTQTDGRTADRYITLSTRRGISLVCIRRE